MPLRLDNVGIVVDDLEAAVMFFTELGMEVEGRATLEGDWVDRVDGMEGTRADIVMLHTPDGTGKLEVTRYRHPAAVGPDPRSEPPNTLGMGRVMFQVDDIDDVVARLHALGGELVGEIVTYEDVYRLCYMRGPEGILLGLAEDVRRD